MKVFYPKKRKQAEQRKALGKVVKNRKLSAKSGRGSNSAPSSTDVNPIENLCDEVERRMKKEQPKK